MAESIVFNNATFIIPDVGESNWGQNLTNYFVAIPQGAYQASGGTLALTADLSFGSSFGLFSPYFTSTTSTPATAGVVRLANTDAVEWRNHANGANLALSVDTSNNLLWNGDIVATASASPVLSITGTSNQIAASAATGNVTLSVPSTFIAPGSIAATTTLAGTTATLSATTNQILLGTTNVITISSTAPASSQTYTIPDAGGAANVILDHGNYTIAGTWSFSNSITLASSKAVILTDNSTHTVTIKATNATTTYTLQLPTTAGSSNYFLQTDGSGNTTWAPGGSGTISSGTTNGVAYYTASTTVGSTSAGTANYPLVANTSAAPTFQQLSLTAGVTGVLPVANGGTNSSAGLNNGFVMGSVGSAIVELAGLKSISTGTGSSVYEPLRALGGSGNYGSIFSAFVTGITNSPTTISAGASGLGLVSGSVGGASNFFRDVVAYTAGGTVVAISSATEGGSPAARTYAGNLTVSFASGTYEVGCVSLGQAVSG